MKKFTKFLSLIMTIFLSSSLLIAQENPVISVQNPKVQAEFVQQTKDLPSQKELDLIAMHGPTLVIPPPREGESRATGDNCSDPIVVTFPAAFPYSNTNTTNGRGNDYSNTVMGVYDDGPDIIYQLVVTSATGMTMTITPVGTYQYAGIGLFSGCLDATNNIAWQGASNGSVSIQVQLNPGNYYLMGDNWPSPAYIDFTLTINQWGPAPGELCSTAINYGNVNDPSMNGTLAAGASVWYSFTSPVNIMATVSLCAGASMDTKLEIYTDCSSSYLFYNDDYCGALSQINNIQLHAGQTYYARVYGYSSSTAGPFNINITGNASPANDDCTTAQPISGPYPQLINGTTIGAFTDCAGVFNWNAVWYSISLPFPVNNLTVDFCGNSPALTNIGTFYYNDCSDCNAYTIMNPFSCNGGWKLTTLGIPGPATIYFPAYVGSPGRNFQFTVDVTPMINITGGGNYCDGGLGVVVGLDGSQAGVSYTLLLDGISTGNVMIGNGNSLSFGLQTSPGVYTVMASPSPDPIGSAQVTIDYPPDPAGPITGNNMVCKGSSGIPYYVDPINNATTYNWAFPIGAVVASGGGTNSITVDFSSSAQTGTIKVWGENNYNCGQGQLSVLHVFLSSIPNTPSISIWKTINLRSSAASGNQWYFSPNSTGVGTPIQNATDKTYQPDVPGNNYYYVIVTNNFGCSSSESNRIQMLKSAEVILSADKALNETDFRIFPNPNDGQFTVLTSGTKGEKYSISVYNALGMKIYELNDEFINDEVVEKTIDLKHENGGIYLLIFQSDNNRQVVKKILIDH